MVYLQVTNCLIEANSIQEVHEEMILSNFKKKPKTKHKKRGHKESDILTDIMREILEETNK